MTLLLPEYFTAFRPTAARTVRSLGVLALALAVVSAGAGAQTTPPPHETAPPELVRTINALDSAAFAAYNTCDLKTFATFWSDDVEFYHDQGGVMIGVDNLVDATRKNICGKTTRRIVPGTVAVYLMKDFGAVQIGVHRFYRAGEESRGAVGEARFVHLWKHTGDRWQVTRVLSFDHHAITP